LPPNHKADAVIGATISERLQSGRGPPQGPEKIVARRPLDGPGSYQSPDREGFICRLRRRFDALSGQQQLKFEVYGSSDSIWNEGDEVGVDFAIDAASIFESQPE
jgi:hypothetical protein